MSKTILVVDDKKEIRVMVQAYLEQEGFRVVTAGDGQEVPCTRRFDTRFIPTIDTGNAQHLCLLQSLTGVFGAAVFQYTWRFV